MWRAGVVEHAQGRGISDDIAAGVCGLGNESLHRDLRRALDRSTRPCWFPRTQGGAIPSRHCVRSDVEKGTAINSSRVVECAPGPNESIHKSNSDPGIGGCPLIPAACNALKSLGLPRRNSPAVPRRAIYRGTNSIVVSRRRVVRKPRTYFSELSVEYFAAYARSTASRMRSLLARIARIRSCRSPTWSVPRGSSRNVRYHPSGFSVHERANTLPSTTTAQMPMNRWSERPPARIPRILHASMAATTRSGNRRLTGCGTLLTCWPSRDHIAS